MSTDAKQIELFTMCIRYSYRLTTQTYKFEFGKFQTWGALCRITLLRFCGYTRIYSFFFSKMLKFITNFQFLTEVQMTQKAEQQK